jgi:hypothetical protein
VIFFTILFLATFERVSILKKNFKAGVALVIVGSLASIASVSPAFADPFPQGGEVYVGPDNNHWVFNSVSEASLSGPFNDTWSSNSYGNSETWDTTDTFLYGSNSSTNAHIECAVPADLTAAADSSGDQILTCDPQTINNGDGDVTVQTEYRFYADGQTWRARYIISNNTGASIVGQVLDVGYNSYQDSGTSLSYTSSAGAIGDWTTDYNTVPSAVTTPTDLSWVTDDRTDEYDSPVVKYAVGSTGSSTLPLDDVTRDFVSAGHGNGNDQTDSYFELPTLAAGQSVEIITLSKVFLFSTIDTSADAPMDAWQTATHNSVLAAIADTAVTSNAVVFAGVSDRTKVLNWIPTAIAPPVEPVVEPVLAATGLDGAALASISGLSVLALIAGAGVLAARRRRHATS